MRPIVVTIRVELSGDLTNDAARAIAAEAIDVIEGTDTAGDIRDIGYTIDDPLSIER